MALLDRLGLGPGTQGAIIGAVTGGLSALMTFNPFAVLPMAVMGAVSGGIMAKMMGPTYQQVNQARDPRMTGYSQTQDFGGVQMPNGIFGNNVPQGSSGGFSKFLKGAAVVGGLALLATMFMHPFGMGMFGMGMPFMGGMGMMNMLGPMAAMSMMAMNPMGMINGTGALGYNGWGSPILGMGGFTPNYAL